MNLPFELFIALRHLRAKKKEGFISVVTTICVTGVALGVMALIVVISVMVGFEADLKARILGGQPQVILMRHGGPFTGYRDVLQQVEKIDGVKAVTPFIYAQVMLRSKNGASGAVLRGIDPATAGHVIKTLNHASLPDPPPPGSTAVGCTSPTAAPR